MNDISKITPAAKPNVANLGTCVVERDGKGFLVMFPDGTVRAFADYIDAIKRINKYFATHTPKEAIGVGQIVSYDGSIIAKVARNGFVANI